MSILRVIAPYADSGDKVDSPYYGYFMRVLGTMSVTFKVNPLIPYIGVGFNELYGSHVDPSDVHSCVSIESFDVDDADHLTGISSLGHYDVDASPKDFLENFDQQELREVLRLESQPQGNTNLEDTIYDIFDTYLHYWGAAGFEFDWMHKFRTVTGILD
ncbi:hypothetical protein SEMRO_136_G064230.1 [Seminavis robusta]|uniref:Uncharacterized protein n=1 Tax=Seminavis robusta TaxID=568900 RepID=A0A9N8DMG5_9STRA|nr:hypothetical protein SEMRO_136_G064230.1 [Seminavis robusta]|eukprot:Sro136_g064230.1 n/a (159) ;mRNA; f:94218-94694